MPLVSNNRPTIRITDISGGGTLTERKIIKRIERSANRIWRRAPSAEVTAVFLSAPAIQKLNREYRHIDRPTTTLSFVYQGSGRRQDPWIGEMMFCRRIIKQRAQAAGQSYPQALAELVAHSLLHLLGYDHQNNTQERTMERWASRITKLLP